MNCFSCRNVVCMHTKKIINGELGNIWATTQVGKDVNLDTEIDATNDRILYTLQGMIY
jgi:hypothetical protein